MMSFCFLPGLRGVTIKSNVLTGSSNCWASMSWPPLRVSRGWRERVKVTDLLYLPVAVMMTGCGVWLVNQNSEE